MRSDGELVIAARDGDARAWDELVDRHGQLVYANARAVGADRGLAQDVGQVVWMRLINRLHTIREPERIKGWLAIVARNTARTELRRRKTPLPLDDIAASIRSGEPEPDEISERRSAAERVGAALGRLSEACRELLTLLFSAEMSYEEISEATGRPIGSIGPTRQRCLASLERELGGVAP